MLQLYNSLTRKKEIFQPIEPGKIRMYVCGITVYDYCHMGHARMFLVFDMILRYLRARGFEVTYVRNITDIDDKIIKRSQENGEDFRALTKRFIHAMHEDERALNIVRPDIEPRATESIDQIIAMIETLLQRGLAYVGSNGDVYYDVGGFDGYGKLSNKNIEDLRAGSRVEVDETKRDPLDFVLWKTAKPGEPKWPSPWGDGRPGWHIECSAMSTRYLGKHFDIHGGGLDLKFPHHENEIAQSEGAHGIFVNYWLHNGFIQVDDEKMSKSLGNFFTVREVLRHYAPEILRFFMLSSHYRRPLNYSEDNLQQAKASLNRLYTALRGLPVDDTDMAIDEIYLKRFNDAMDDDFNTPEAIAVLHDLTREINRLRETDQPEAQRLAASLCRLGAILGLLQDDPESFLQNAAGNDAGISAQEIEALIEQRSRARQEKNWPEADRIRELLSAQGVVLEDKAGVTSWRRE